MSQPLFSLGQTAITPGALTAMLAAGHPPFDLLYRHQHGDWGECDAEDRAANDHAIGRELRIFSAYLLADKTRVWVITDADRSRTTILLPEDY